MSEVLPKKRILFVDDESMVLQGLQRMLRSMRGEWDMEFVESGAQALKVMAERSFDVLVSDMRMPGMSGAELLNTVMARHPDTTRIILSGHADQELIAQCLGSAHQFLSKPCDPELLKALINQACRLGSDLASAAVKEVVGRIENLPSVPAIYQAMTQALESETTSAQDLGRIIAQDIGMTAMILKLVNSAFFGLRRELSNATEAVTYLGIDTVRSLVLVNGLFGHVKSLKTRQLSIEALWSHSLSVARGSRLTARSLNLPGTLQEQAFIAGLLHDCGILILAHAFPARYDEVIGLAVSELVPIAKVEQRLLEVDHAEVGAYLMGLWGLPAAVVQSIRYHHAPSLPAGADLAVLQAVHLAEVFSHSSAEGGLLGQGTVDPSVAAQPEIANHLLQIQEAMENLEPMAPWSLPS